ncbi:MULTISPECIES: alpha/beta fold hydrolase [Paraburkholderia]|uniref:alpha/beta fold hydrolase n=1 Tax=Paraburkholderia TaxID=1822464 RepID=UPI000377CBE8|nr:MULTISPECIES: alpha/beta hydrolase [Paraburkholderia]MDH6147518.1 pimeloyl-ACP methyl ester carboxylesterase [Paraburkholderia sp. WSM4179]
MNSRIFLADDGARLYCRGPSDSAAHDAVPVLMLHSLFFDGSMFDAVRALLSTDLAVYAPDHRGQGRSGAGREAPSIDRLASDTIGIIETLGAGPVHLVGSSMGGYVALRIAQRRPDLLRSCVLSCCTAHAERQPERFAALEQRIRDEGTALLGPTLLQTMFGERFVAEDGEVCRAWRRHFESLGRSAADPVQGVFARPGYEALLADVRLPLLLFSGELDRAKRPADMQYIAERVAGSRHVTVGDSGHTPPVENPALFAAELLRFWNESTPVAARALN